ncbi:hypothetical protein KZJ38_16545 [Paraburkholderia edwinii]|uniref:Uncharacterized protein n=1 Tax=Paraburkholderia edwinii TaxID=2861782 RepID=A0ABX8UGH5_9BURK|nr:hypothetical protein [Paraburkholderia edwinii]QYD67908.1 hypothetical protein KZJ38_16545 [Paraburkholderia edwinii]
MNMRVSVSVNASNTAHGICLRDAFRHLNRRAARHEPTSRRVQTFHIVAAGRQSWCETNQARSEAGPSGEAFIKLFCQNRVARDSDTAHKDGQNAVIEMMVICTTDEYRILPVPLKVQSATRTAAINRVCRFYIACRQHLPSRPQLFRSDILASMRGERAVGEGVCPSLGEAQGFFRPREIQWLGKAGNDIRWNEMAFPMKEPGNVIASIHSIEGHGLGLRDAHKDPEPAIWLQIVVLHVSSSKSGGGHQTYAIEAPQGTMDERSVNGRPVKFRFRWADLASAQSATRFTFTWSRQC